ncbi:MAG TPA: hypothetical protein PK659_09015 [Methanothrix sp.]|nr:hypothetical protein [Methanothrix sp.]HOL44377.1 hypothetical protein [Methanothrix sp.]
MDTVTFLTRLMMEDRVLMDMVDRRVLAELPRIDAPLDGPHKSVVGCTETGRLQESYFKSQIRGHIRSEINAHVMVVSGYGQNDAYCRSIIGRLEQIFQDAQYIGAERIFINSISSEVRTDSPPGKWVGSVKLSITKFDPV